MAQRNVLVIGDVHGCASELEELLSAADLDTIDLVVFAGDLVDKGPHTVKVVKMARKLSKQVPVVLVEGNHEERHRRFRRHLMRGDTKTAHSLRDADFLQYITEQLNDKDLAFLDSAVLYYELPEHHAMVVHGGVPPKLDKLPSNRMSAVEKLPGKSRRRAKMMQLIRYVTPDGSPVEKDKEKKGDNYWADVYDGRFGTVLFGHQPFVYAAEPVTFPNAIGLDLGCAAGNALGGAILRPGKPAEFLARPAARQYHIPNRGARAMPDLHSDRWLGYVMVNDRWVAVAEADSADEALRLASIAG
jgi:serine/threonine protein phosphatase 1